MSKFRIAHVLFGALVLFSPRLLAQEPPPQQPGTNDPNLQDRRIVDGRPRGYFLKRAFHPVSWVDAGVFRPTYRLASTQIYPRISLFRPRAVSIGVGGAGPSSGFGPVVTPLNLRLFGDQLEIETPLVYTYKRYEVYKVNLRAPLVVDGPLGTTRAYVTGAYRSRVADKFFGLGNDSLTENESFYRTVHREAAAGLSFEIRKGLISFLQIGFQNVGVTDARKDARTQKFFTENEAP